MIKGYTEISTQEALAIHGKRDVYVLVNGLIYKVFGFILENIVVFYATEGHNGSIPITVLTSFYVKG